MSMKEIRISKSELIQYAAEKIPDDNLEIMGDRWLENVKDNRKYYNNNPVIPGIIVFIIGAGPSLNKNIEELKLIPKNSRGYIMCVDASLSILIDNDIIPDYCMTIDASDKILDMISDIDTSNITLLSSCSANKNIVENWKGDRYFFNLKSSYIDFDNKIYKASQIRKATNNIKNGNIIEGNDYELLFDGILNDVMTGGNVTSTALSFAITKMNAQKVIFVGLDFSWKKDENFYAGDKHIEMAITRVDADTSWELKDINNNIVMTNVSLWKFNNWHQQFLMLEPNKVVNATEGGIFGIKKDGTINDMLEYLTLKNAINKYL